MIWKTKKVDFLHANLWMKIKQEFLLLYKLMEKFLIHFPFRESLAIQQTQYLVATTQPVSNPETKHIKGSIIHAKLRMPQMLKTTFSLEYLTLRYTVTKFKDNLSYFLVNQIFIFSQMVG